MEAILLSPAATETPDFELHDDLKKTICLRAGGSLRLFIKVTGRPIPTLTWSKPGVDLHNRGFIEVTNTSTTLIIDKVHRYDAGKYTLVAENSAGKQEVNILVKVYGTLKRFENDLWPFGLLYGILKVLKSDFYYNGSFLLPLFFHVIQ